MPVRSGVFPAWAVKPPRCYGIFYFAAQGFSLNRWRSRHLKIILTCLVLNPCTISLSVLIIVERMLHKIGLNTNIKFNVCPIGRDFRSGVIKLYQSLFNAVPNRFKTSSLPIKANMSNNCGPPATPVIKTLSNCMSTLPTCASAL